MYCRNCGKPVPQQAVMCIACGVPTKSGTAFCQNCGAPTSAAAEICLKCGARLARPHGGGKDWLTTLLLCLFLGWFGIHRFYTGSTAIGVVQLLTLGGCGIWWLIDFITILTGAYTDAAGNPLVKR
jgi:RNA polymerase subunit RPABC4/transcription elongation factor Spt4